MSVRSGLLLLAVLGVWLALLRVAKSALEWTWKAPRTVGAAPRLGFSNDQSMAVGAAAAAAADKVSSGT